MKRRQVFEWEDLPWFPERIRNYMTDYLQFISNLADFYRPMAPILEKALRKTGNHRIIDLASGGGGGLLKLVDRLGEEVEGLEVVLTDYYPNRQAFERAVARRPDVFRFEERSVNALEVPSDLVGFRTQFLSFHHFEPEQGRQILQNAVDSDAPIAVFEAQRRDLSHLVRFAISPIFLLLLTPFVRPFRWGRLLFTYLIPIVPLCTGWDGAISVLRTYTVEELKEMVGGLSNTDAFEWEVGEHVERGMTVTYLVGVPRSSVTA